MKCARVFTGGFVSTNTQTQNNINNNNGIEAKRQNKGKGTSNVICYKRLVTRIL